MGSSSRPTPNLQYVCEQSRFGRRKTRRLLTIGGLFLPVSTGGVTAGLYSVTR
jgi:hypothetical protein